MRYETEITDLNLSRLEQIAGFFELSTVELLTFNEPGEQERFDSDLVKMKARLKRLKRK